MRGSKANLYEWMMDTAGGVASQFVRMFDVCGESAVLCPWVVPHPTIERPA